MASDLLFLSNDTVGYNLTDAIGTKFANPFVNDTSALTGSAGNVAFLGPMPLPGRVVDFGLAVFRPAISASGFVSGTVDATLRINSTAILSVNPSINMLTTSAAIGAPYTTQFAASYSAGQASAATINTNSAAFAKGDFISYDHNARSVGSAAAGAAGIGLRLYVVLRYNAI